MEKKIKIEYLEYKEADLIVLETKSGQVSILPDCENTILTGKLLYIENNSKKFIINKEVLMVFENNSNNYNIAKIFVNI